jgi:hypothetical protein
MRKITTWNIITSVLLKGELPNPKGESIEVYQSVELKGALGRYMKIETGDPWRQHNRIHYRVEKNFHLRRSPSRGLTIVGEVQALRHMVEFIIERT